MATVISKPIATACRSQASITQLALDPIYLCRANWQLHIDMFPKARQHHKHTLSQTTVTQSIDAITRTIGLGIQLPVNCKYNGWLQRRPAAFLSALDWVIDSTCLSRFAKV
jgi:hypothetical protein